MKLLEITRSEKREQASKEDTREDLVKAVTQWVQQSDQTASPEDMKVIMKEIKTIESPFREMTRMYRYIFVADDGSLGHIEGGDGSNKEMKQHVLSHEMAQRPIHSFSKSKNGADIWLEYHDDVDFEDGAERMIDVLVDQRGAGISVAKVFQHAKQIEADSRTLSYLERAAEVEEIIAPYYPSVFHATIVAAHGADEQEEYGDEQEDAE